jgi:predicted ATPase
MLGGRPMIRQFTVKDFKCYEDINEFNFPGLTVLCGTNNSGKSSLLQSIYLLTQILNTEIPTLSLNNINFKLGIFSDILYKGKSNEETIEFSILFDKNFLSRKNINYLSVNLVFKKPSTFQNISLMEGNPLLSAMEIKFQRKDDEIKDINLQLIDKKDLNIYEIKGNLEQGYTTINNLVLSPIIYSDIHKKERKLASSDYEIIADYLKLINSRNLHYLKAYRVDDYIHSGKNILGISGEHTAEIIGNNWNLNTNYRDPNGQPVKFSVKFEEWIKQLLGKQFRLEPKKEINGYKIIIEETDNKKKFELFQVGFGISQILPILTLLLTSKENDIILIENPEIHLHPKLQADLVDLFIFAMEANRKLIIETHSDHIINRIRLRIKQNNVLREKINIYFFEKEEYCKYQEIEIGEKGNLDYWPKDFFDQSYNDLLDLIK